MRRVFRTAHESERRKQEAVQLRGRERRFARHRGLRFFERTFDEAKDVREKTLAGALLLRSRRRLHARERLDLDAKRLVFGAAHRLFDEFGKEHGRQFFARFRPFHREDRLHDVEQDLERNFVAPLHAAREVRERDRAVAPVELRARHGVGQERAHVAEEGRIVPIDDRRIKALRKTRVPFRKQPKRLTQVPPLKVPDAFARQGEYFGERFEHQVAAPIDGHVDEAHVVVGVGRSEAPAAAAGFGGVKNADAVFALDRIETRIDFGADRGIDEVHDFFG